jgi:transposase
MKRTKVYYDRIFRDKAIKLALNSSQAFNKTAKELGINPATLYQWLKRYQASDAQNTPSKEDVYAELAQLRKENIRLKEEREILKKAAVYFAQVSE